MPLKLTAAERRRQAELRIKHRSDKELPVVMPSSEQIQLQPITIVNWENCYNNSWGDALVPAAYAHPAKASRGLLNKIYDHLFETGNLSKHSVVLDPFSGIGTTAIIGAWRSVQVIGVELEPKFISLAKENLELHRYGWETMGLPIPIIIQGDSRYLRKHLELADVVVSSPPYAELGANIKGHGIVGAGVSRDKNYGEAEYGQTEGQLGAMKEGGSVDVVISSPPYAEIAAGAGGLNTKSAAEGQQGGRSAESASQQADQRYGDTDGQLAKMAKASIDVIVSSPPFQHSLSSGETSSELKSRYANSPTGGDWGKSYGDSDGQLGSMKSGEVSTIIGSPPYEDALSARGGRQMAQAGIGHATSGANDPDKSSGVYGVEDGQLGSMPTEGVSAVVSSPPYKGSLQSHTDHKDADVGGAKRQETGGATAWSSNADGSRSATGYSEAPENIGNSVGNTFWEAARMIVSECHAILKPGGVAVWIVKSFVRDKQIVDFPGDWRKLCEHCGFTTELEVHAMLVQETTDVDLFGHETVNTKARKSFFRRLAEKRGAPKIDFEVVYFMRKL